MKSVSVHSPTKSVFPILIITLSSLSLLYCTSSNNHSSKFAINGSENNGWVNEERLKKEDTLVNWFQCSRSYSKGKYSYRKVSFAFYLEHINIGGKKFRILSWDINNRVNFFTMRDPETNKRVFLEVDRKNSVATLYSKSLYKARSYYHIANVIK